MSICETCGLDDGDGHFQVEHPDRGMTVKLNETLPAGWYRPKVLTGRKNHYLVAGVPLCGRKMSISVERVRTNYNFCRDCMRLAP